MNHSYKTTPRLYVDQDLIASQSIIMLDEDQTHYLKHVLRLNDGSLVRLFNGRDGEFLASWNATSKKISQLCVTDLLCPMIRAVTPDLHLFFPLIKKDRQDWLIEKAVELGVTDLHPIITDHVVIRDFKEGRVKKQIIEASEQCERLTVPKLHPLITLSVAVETFLEEHLFIALERQELPLLKEEISNVKDNAADLGFLFGPEGGFSSNEVELLKRKNRKNIHLVTLGSSILRAETAGLYGLIQLRD
jgi:16S rRNA (uracil1498-N3)-methyltransferase